MKRRLDPLERLLNRVKCEENGCWTFIGSEKGEGYGQFKLDGKNMLAHVASWILHHGPTNGLFVLHKCIKNRKCVNPDHLYLGTAQDNSNDMVAQGHQRDQNGSKNNCAIMNEEKVLEMRRGPRWRGMYVHYSKEHGVELSVVRRAILGITWKHVPMK